MANLNPILQQVEMFRQQAGASMNEMQDVYSKLNALSNNDVQTLQDIGANSALIDSTKQLAEMQAQQEKIKKAAELGIVPGKATDVLTGLADVIGQAFQEKTAAQAEIATKRSVSMLSDPVQWLMNQFTVNQDIEKHNAADRKLDAATQQYERVNRLTQTTATTQTALAASVTAATIQAGADNIQAQAQLLSTKAIKDGLIYNAQGIKQILDIKNQDLSISFSVLNAEATNQRLNLEMENAARQREQWEWKKQEKDLLERDDNAIVESINRGGLMRMGDQYTPLKAGTAAANNAIALLKSNSPVGKTFQEDYLRGQQGILAASPAQALDMFKTQPVNISPAQLPVRRVLEAALQATQATPGFDPKNRAAVEQTINAQTRAIVDQQVANIQPEDENNVFNIPAMAAVIKQVPELANLPVVQKLLAPRISAGDSLNRPDDLFQTVAKGVQEGKITYNEALDTVYLYQRGVALNLAARNLENFGITTSAPNSKYSYRTRITTHPETPFGNKEIVDLTKVDTFARALNTYMAQQYEIKAREAVGGALNKMLFPVPNALRGGPVANPPRGMYPDLFDPKGYGFGKDATP